MEINGLDVHFIQVKSLHEKGLPLIITHGWPGSVMEMLNVVGPLTDPVAQGEVRAAFRSIIARRESPLMTSTVEIRPFHIRGAG